MNDDELPKSSWGGKRSGSGRKVKGIEPKTESVTGRISKTVKDVLKEHGGSDGDRIENYVRRSEGLPPNRSDAATD